MPDVNRIVIEVGTALTEAERLVIEATLQGTGWNMSRCARVLGIDYGTLYAKLRAYRLAEQSGSVVGFVPGHHCDQGENGRP
jgi:DNA-binding NtrC family response regulator